MTARSIIWAILENINERHCLYTRSTKDISYSFLKRAMSFVSTKICWHTYIFLWWVVDTNKRAKGKSQWWGINMFENMQYEVVPSLEPYTQIARLIINLKSLESSESWLELPSKPGCWHVPVLPLHIEINILTVNIKICQCSLSCLPIEDKE